jgi:hypothetical protein
MPRGVPFWVKEILMFVTLAVFIGCVVTVGYTILSRGGFLNVLAWSAWSIGAGFTFMFTRDIRQDASLPDMDAPKSRYKRPDVPSDN